MVYLATLSMLAMSASVLASPILVDDAKACSNSFRALTAKGFSQECQGPVPSSYSSGSASHTFDLPDDHWDINYIDGYVLVNKATGRVTQAWSSLPCPLDATYDPGAAHTSAELLALFQAWWEAAGHAGQLTLTASGVGSEDETTVAWAWACPTVGNVPYHYEHRSYIEIGYRTGRLAEATFIDVPTPPADVTTTYPAAQAEAQVIGYILANMSSSSVTLDGPTTLCIWGPSKSKYRNDVDDFITPAQYQLGRENGSMLVYCIRAMHCSTPDYDDDPQGYYYEGFVDAKTGTLMRVTEYGGGGRGAGRAPVPFGWDLTPGQTSVLGAATATVPKGDVDRAYPKNPPAKGVKLILKRCRVYIPVEFDAKSGLLWTGKGKLRSYGKPNAPLLKALKAAKPAKPVCPKPNKAQ